ncbi:ABC transporter ATP-binding protein [Aquimarina hainanensis]|uniref:ABC transporter ATP-binding protein n=1 Tax=Aquimarina hainanensis TaxID=1578017 RepID=A0ABW5NER6_9FLAO
MQLEINQVSKRYSKNKWGIQAYTLSAGKGILGLLGPNGAGKSTLLKMIATLHTPTEGHILLNKNNIVKDPNYLRKQLGYLPQDFGVYESLNAYEFLQYIAALKGLEGKKVLERIHYLLEGVNLLASAKRPIGTYSGGMKQRIGIAQALLNNPKLILLDEPTVGLDPEERVRFRNLLTDLSQQSIIILSSHIVSDIDTIADSVAIMKQGRLLVHQHPEEIIKVAKGYIFESSIPLTSLASFKKDHILISYTRKKDVLTVRYACTSPEIPATPVTPTLEDAYLYLTNTTES